MGTINQAEALLRLYARLGKIPTATLRAELKAKILAASNEEIRHWFAMANAETGFDRDTSMSTPNQRNKIGRMERAMYGQLRSKPWQMTFADASMHIDALLLQQEFEKNEAREHEALVTAFSAELEKPHDWEAKSDPNDFMGLI